MMDAADNTKLRQLFGVFIAVALGMAVAHVFAATLVHEPSLHRDDGKANDRRRLWPAKKPRPMPTFSSNDRSRWATVRALVEHGTYVVGKRDTKLVTLTGVATLAASDPLEAAVLGQAGFLTRTTKDTGIIFEDGWQSVDKVLHPQTLEFYSSKPPFLATLIAGLYWLLQMLTGWNLVDEPAEMVRLVLILVNVLPFALYLYLMGRLVQRFGTTDWGRMFVMATACFGTLLSPFLFTLNNHTLGTFSVLFALASVVKIWDAKQAGNIDRAWYHFVLAGLCAAFAVTNELPSLSFAGLVLLLLFWWSPKYTLFLYLPPALLIAAGFFWTNYLAVGQLRPAYSEFYGPWYQYEGSHFRQPIGDQIRYGIDFARYHETWPTFALHLLAGHHGFFSLTPVWILAFISMLWMRRRPIEATHADGLPWFVPALTLVVSVVVLGFYLSINEGRNYGGWSVGPRWLIWLTPLLLLSMVPVADWLGVRPWGRCVGLACLGVSALSANYPGWNPWRMPWIYDWMEWMGWIGY